MKRAWNDISDKVNALSSRERLIIIVTFFMLSQMVVSLVLQPQLTARLNREKSNFELNIARIQQQSNDIYQQTQEHLAGSNAAYIRRINELRIKIESHSPELLEISESFIAPTEMIAFIKALLGQHHLRIEHLENKPAEAITSNDTKDSSKKVAIYKHRVYFEATGSYTDQIQFLNKLEHLPWHIFWHKFHLEAGDNSPPTIGIELFTLNFGPSWIKL